MGKKTKNEAPNQFSPHLSNTQRDTNFPPKKCISENIKITKENIFVVVRPTNKNITKTTIKKWKITILMQVFGDFSHNKFSFGVFSSLLIDSAHEKNAVQCALEIQMNLCGVRYQQTWPTTMAAASRSH